MKRRRFRREFQVEAVRLIKERGVAVSQRLAISTCTRTCCARESRSCRPIPRKHSQGLARRSRISLRLIRCGAPIAKAPRRARLDTAVLGNILGTLDRSRLSTGVTDLAAAARTGTIVLTREMELQVAALSREVAEIMQLLMRALGLDKGQCLMILKARQSGVAMQLAVRLLRTDENDHVELDGVAS